MIKGKVEKIERYVCTLDLNISTNVSRQTSLIIPSTKNDFYSIQLSRIYALLIFLIGSERAERAATTRKYLTTTAAAVPDATKPKGEKIHSRVKSEVEKETGTKMDKNQEHNTQRTLIVGSIDAEFLQVASIL